MQVSAFIQQLHTGKIPPLVLLLGSERALSEKALKAIMQLVPEDQKTMNLARYDMRQTPVGVALDDASSPPFFGDFRVVIIDQPYFLTGEKNAVKIEHDLDGLTAYFKNPVPSTVMVIAAPYPKLDERKRLTKTLKKNALLVDAQPLNERLAQTAIQTALRQAKITITPGAMQALLNRTNADYSVMIGQLPKLKLYAQSSGKIDAQAIEALVPKQLSDRVFDLVADVLKKDTASALSLYRELLLQKEEPIRLNSLLISQFRLLLQVQILAAKGYSQGSVASVLKVHPYRVKLAFQQNRRISTASLREAYNGLVETEAAMKTGQIDKNLAFELFVLRYAGGQLARFAD